MTTFTAGDGSSHAAAQLTDPVGEHVAIFDLVWGGTLASLKQMGIERLNNANTGALVQPTMYYFPNSLPYQPAAAGDYLNRGAAVPVAACSSLDQVFIMTAMVDYAAGSSGYGLIKYIKNDLVGSNPQESIARVQDGMYNAPYVLTTVARFVPNPAGQPQYYLKLEHIITNNHPTEFLPFGFWYNASVPFGQSTSAVAPSACSSGRASEGTPYLIAGLYSSSSLTDGTALYVSPQHAWGAGTTASTAFSSDPNTPRRTISMVNAYWGIQPNTSRRWSIFVLTGPWANALSFAQAGGPEPAPSISTVTPASGRVPGGELVTISGSHFVVGATVSLGGAQAFATVQSAATIVAKTGTHAPGLVDVVVTNPDGQVATLANGFTYNGLGLYSLAPCRVLDTRNPNGPSGGPILTANSSRSFPVAGTCGVPTTARAVAITMAVVSPGDQGDIRLYPAGTPPPLTSAINFRAGVIRAGNGIIPLGTSGQMSATCDMPVGSAGATHFIVDVYGYFQ
jgi:hypothetical protein